MTLSVVSVDDISQQLAERNLAAVGTDEWLLDLLRADVHAHGQTTRTACLERLRQLIMPILPVDRERLLKCCDLLIREGDLTLAPGGRLYATPLRVMQVTDRARLLGSVPTRFLATSLGTSPEQNGAQRTLLWSDELVANILDEGGCQVTAESWAGLNHAAPADEHFLQTLDQRLQWEARPAGTLERDVPLAWCCWSAPSEKPAKGKRTANETGPLWYAPRPFSGYHHVWTAGESPAKNSFVELGHDDANRARFALMRRAGTPPVISVTKKKDQTVLAIPGWLPFAEYRWLSLHAQMMEWKDGVAHWSTRNENLSAISDMLSRQLGMEIT